MTEYDEQGGVAPRHTIHLQLSTARRLKDYCYEHHLDSYNDAVEHLLNLTMNRSMLRLASAPNCDNCEDRRREPPERDDLGD